MHVSNEAVPVDSSLLKTNRVPQISLLVSSVLCWCSD